MGKASSRKFGNARKLDWTVQEDIMTQQTMTQEEFFSHYSGATIDEIRIWVDALPEKVQWIGYAPKKGAKMMYVRCITIEGEVYEKNFWIKSPVYYT
jgi:hypothetical protein